MSVIHEMYMRLYDYELTYTRNSNSTKYIEECKHILNDH